MYNITPIKNYILLLKNKHGLSVTVHPLVYKSVLLSGEMRLFNIHNSSYCAKIKSCPQAADVCLFKQNSVFEKSRHGAFFGVCHAGVRERVYPIRFGDEPVGFISVGGYKAENGGEYIKKIGEKYSIPTAELERAYDGLKEMMPSEEELDTFILPLCDMIELALIKTDRKDDGDLPLARRVVRYIKANHHREITSEELCHEFAVSRSKLSAEFNAFMGESIPNYVNRLRIEDAKGLLASTSLSATEIAYLVGYTDSNYFSAAFKKAVGKSPREYRKENI